jgi:hypothetical protein
MSSEAGALPEPQSGESLTLEEYRVLVAELRLVAKERAEQITSLIRQLGELEATLPENERARLQRLQAKSTEYDRFRSRRIIRIVVGAMRPVDRVRERVAAQRHDS